MNFLAQASPFPLLNPLLSLTLSQAQQLAGSSEGKAALAKLSASTPFTIYSNKD